MKEICNKCPLTPEVIEKHGGANVCSALGGSREFSLNKSDCLAVAMLNEMGEHPTTFSKLLSLFSKLETE
ncbi:hypothetical protein ACFL1M_03170 [Patescibacteria group bacterium]